MSHSLPIHSSRSLQLPCNDSGMNAVNNHLYHLQQLAMDTTQSNALRLRALELHNAFASSHVHQSLTTPSSVPAPRLVGIELNPGPRSSKPNFSSSIAEGIAAMISARGIPAMKKKSKRIAAIVSGKASGPLIRRRRELPSGYNINMDEVRTIQRAPTQSMLARKTANGVNHTPFCIRGRTIGPIVGTSATGTPVFLTTAGAGSSTSRFTLDIVSSGNTASNFSAFPSVLRTLGTVFLRYRFKKFQVSFTSTSNTSTANTIYVGVTPEVSSTDSSLTVATVGSMQRNFSCSAWGTVTGFDAMGEGGLRKEWLFLDSSNPVQASARQEGPGSFAYSYDGTVINGAQFGRIMFDYEIEFEGLADEASFGAVAPLPTLEPGRCCGSSSCRCVRSSSSSNEEEKWFVPPPRLQVPGCAK